MTIISPDATCESCGGRLVPPQLAFDRIVPSKADYVCLKCRRPYRWAGEPPRLVPMVVNGKRPAR